MPNIVQKHVFFCKLLLRISVIAKQKADYLTQILGSPEELTSPDILLSSFPSLDLTLLDGTDLDHQSAATRLCHQTLPPDLATQIRTGLKYLSAKHCCG